MVEINNQRKAFLDMLAWSEGTDNGRQKTRNHGYDVIVGRRAICWLLDHPRKLVTLNTKLQSTGAGRYQLLSVGGMPARKQLGLKDFSPTVRTLWHCSRLRSVAHYDWSWWYPWSVATVVAISGLHCRAGCGQFEHKADSLIAKIRSEWNGQRDWCMSRVTAILSALVLCIIVCLSWAVNHCRDNAITYKAAARQKCQRTEAGERGNYWHADASAWCLLRSMQNKKSWRWCWKLKMMSAYQ